MPVSPVDESDAPKRWTAPDDPWHGYRQGGVDILETLAEKLTELAHCGVIDYSTADQMQPVVTELLDLWERMNP
jgi:hypothetical protein